jgi:hypothetical protein
VTIDSVSNTGGGYIYWYIWPNEETEYVLSVSFVVERFHVVEVGLEVRGARIRGVAGSWSHCHPRPASPNPQ